MALLVADCPRCGVQQMTFDLTECITVDIEEGWAWTNECFCVCRSCAQATLFVLKLTSFAGRGNLSGPGALRKFDGFINPYVDIVRFVSVRDRASHAPPDFLPDELAETFREGATCLSVECWNAAGAMFRACVDLATRPLLPAEGVELEGLNRKVRRDLGLRLPWLFKTGRLPKGLDGLAACIREDGNDAAHQVNLEKEDAEDLLDFTRALLERLYTEPGRLKEADQRRAARRGPKT